MAASTEAVITAAIINIVTCIIAFLVFCFFRIRPCCEKFYAPKVHMPLPQKGLWTNPPMLPMTFFGWLKPIWDYKEPKIISSAGLDTAMYLRIFTFGNQLFFFVTIWCCVILLPIHLTGDEIDYLMANPSPPPPSTPSTPPLAPGQDPSSPVNPVTGAALTFKFTSFDKCSLSNVPAASNRMWAHVISVYVITAVVIYLLWKLSKESVLLRIMFLANTRKGGATHSVLVTDIPGVSGATGRAMSERKALEKSAKKLEKERKKSIKSGNGDVLLGTEGLGRSTSEAGSLNKLTSVSKSQSAKPAGSIEPSTFEPEMSTPPIPPPVRRRQYDYNVKDETLDPVNLAKAMLKKGLSAKEMVESEFHGVFPGGAVQQVNMVYDHSALSDMVTEYNKHKQSLEDYLDMCKNKISKGKHVARPKTFIIMSSLGPWGKERYGGGLIKRVDALDFWIARLKELDDVIAVEQERAKEVVWPSAFVTFRTRKDQTVSASSLHQHDTTTWITSAAPEPAELIWCNLGRTYSYRSTATLIMWVVFWLMVFFFMIPVLAVQGLIETSKLEKIPGLSGFLTNPVISKLLEAIVPGLALKIFLAIVPMLLGIMLHIQGVTCLSLKDFGIVTRYFIFQVVVVFVFNTIGGSFFSQVQQWIDAPGSVVTVLGTAIPQVSTFFITYIWISGLAVKPVGFIRIPGLVIYWLLGKLSGSPKARERLWMEQYTTLGNSLCDHTITIMLGLIYCCINPIIAPSCLAYFLVVSFIERYNNIYVLRRQYESSGMLWRRVFNQVMVGLYLFQLVLLGLLGIKKFPFTVLIIPAPLISITFHIMVISLFDRPWQLMSLHDAAELDRVDEGIPLLQAKGSSTRLGDPTAPASVTAAADKAEVATAEATEMGGVDERDVEIGLDQPPVMDPGNYISPAFKITKGDIDDLLTEAEEMGPVLDEMAKKEEEAKAEKGGCFGGGKGKKEKYEAPQEGAAPKGTDTAAMADEPAASGTSTGYPAASTA